MIFKIPWINIFKTKNILKIQRNNLKLVENARKLQKILIFMKQGLVICFLEMATDRNVKFGIKDMDKYQHKNSV